MTVRTASCRCGQASAHCEGEPVRISVCHCLECQRRSGSAFAVQARFPAAAVTLRGETRTWERTADSGRRARYLFCQNCGSTLAYANEGWPGLIAVPVGAFADPDFPAPAYSVYEHRRHRWVGILGDQVEHSSSPSIVRQPRS